MRVLTAILCGTAATAFLVACSAGNSQPAVAPNAQTPFVDIAAVTAPSGAETIVADGINSAVSIFSRTGKLNAYITAGLNGPSGVATDSAQQLYIANTQAGNVLVYAKPYTALTRTLKVTSGLPVGVAVSSTGVVAVMNGGLNGSGSVSFYPAGSVTPCATVAGPGLSPMFGGFDAAGDLFFDGYSGLAVAPIVAEISGGCSATAIQMLHVGNKLFQPAALQVVHGNILIMDEPVFNQGPVLAVFNPVIYTYAPPSGGSLGLPTITTWLTQGITPAAFAMSSDGKHLWIVHGGVGAGRIEYTYPRGRFVRSNDQFARKSGLFDPTDIAVNPPLIP
jgi:hypothetical protein